MKKIITTLITVAILATASTLTTNAATQVYDLKTDWSDTQNPNGTWSYRDHAGALLSNAPFPWTHTCEYLEAIARASEAFVHPYGSLEPGDIFLLPASCGVTLRWTAPANGTINLSGNTWLCIPDMWWLTHNGIVLSSDDSTAAGTGDLSSGSGGATALQNIAVQAGDHVEILFVRWLLCGDFSPAGLNFTITLTTDSVDSVAALEALQSSVVEMNLQSGIENSLDAKLDSALNALDELNANNDAAACHSLQAFICAVEAQRGDKITSTQADRLIAAAQQIQSSLNCGN